LIKKFLGDHMKYHLDEYESYKDLHTTREQLKTSYIKAERSLFDKKEKLFKSADLHKWGGFTDNLVPQKMRDELLADKEKAFNYMLPVETK
jgi:hypothetical protein